MKKRVHAFQQNMSCQLLEYKNIFPKPSSDFGIFGTGGDFKMESEPPKFRCSQIKKENML